MFIRGSSDLHMHLNGSFNMPFLKKIAEKNNKTAEYKKLVEAREEYQALLQQSSNLTDVHEHSIPLIWKQFGFIHKIIQDLEDIKQGAMNVIESSKAAYLEIRTTPKALNNYSWQEYVNAFVAGLQEGNQIFKHEKAAYGILSLDRTCHTEKEAYQIVDRVVEEKQKTGLLVGIDICGDPSAKRTLTHESLNAIIKYVLSKDIGLAIHIGEINNEIESADTNIILNTLNDWKSKHANNKLCGKVRLGHGIFFNDEQRALIKKMEAPIEICPAGHRQINWWKKDSSHPITQIYKSPLDPVVVGTDDEIVFGSTIKQEIKTVLKIFNAPQEEQSLEDTHAHQSKFRFGS